MLTNSYITINGSGSSVPEMVNSFVDDTFNKLNSVVPFKRIYVNSLKHNGSSVCCFREGYELIDNKVLIFEIWIPASFITNGSSFNFYIRQKISDEMIESSSSTSNLLSIDGNFEIGDIRNGYYTRIDYPDYTSLHKISFSLFYTELSSETCALFSIKSNSKTRLEGFSGIYKINNENYCVSKSYNTGGDYYTRIWDINNTNYYIAPLIPNGITIDKEDSCMTMPVFLSGSLNYNTSTPAVIYTNYFIKDWLIADSYHCVPNSIYTINGNDYLCSHIYCTSTNSIKYSLLIKI